MRRQEGSVCCTNYSDSEFIKGKHRVSAGLGMITPWLMGTADPSEILLSTTASAALSLLSRELTGSHRHHRISRLLLTKGQA